MLKFTETKNAITNKFVLTIKGMIGDADGYQTEVVQFDDTPENKELLEGVVKFLIKAGGPGYRRDVEQIEDFGKYFDEDFGWDYKENKPLPGYEDGNPHFICHWPLEPYQYEPCPLEFWSLKYYNEQGVEFDVTFEEA